jgi:hypothetical protein
MEYRLQAKKCQELAKQASEFYVETALMELARDYDRAARQAERRERGRDAFGFPNLQAPAR